MSRVPTPVEITPQRLNWLADDAVHCEPVSAANSLLTGKVQGIFRRLLENWLRSVRKDHRKQGFMGEFPCASEQGIFDHLCREILRISREIHNAPTASRSFPLVLLENGCQDRDCTLAAHRIVRYFGTLANCLC